MSGELLYMKIFMERGSSDANGELFKEDDDKAMIKGPYEI